MPNLLRFRSLCAALVAAAVLALAGCGVKGPLEPPPDVPRDEIQDPDAKEIPPEDEERPSPPFILDGLLM